MFSRGMSPFERVAASGHKSIQLNCGWHGNDKHWNNGITYAGTPNNNLGEFLLVMEILFSSLVRAPRLDNRCGLSQRATFPTTTDWKYTVDEAGHCDPKSKTNATCCSPAGYCGSSAAHCDNGLDFGES